MKRVYKLKIIATLANGDPVNIEFKKGMGAGVIATHEIVVELPEEEFSEPMFLSGMSNAAEELRDMVVKTDIELINVNGQEIIK